MALNRLIVLKITIAVMEMLDAPAVKAAGIVLVVPQPARFALLTRIAQMHQTLLTVKLAIKVQREKYHVTCAHQERTNWQRRQPFVRHVQEVLIVKIQHR